MKQRHELVSKLFTKVTDYLRERFVLMSTEEKMSLLFFLEEWCADEREEIIGRPKEGRD